MFSINDVKQFIHDEQSKLWGIALLAGLMNGFASLVILIAMAFYAYRDSKNVAFDSTMLDDSNDIIKIKPWERGY